MTKKVYALYEKFAKSVVTDKPQFHGSVTGQADILDAVQAGEDLIVLADTLKWSGVTYRKGDTFPNSAATNLQRIGQLANSGSFARGPQWDEARKKAARYKIFTRTISPAMDVVRSAQTEANKAASEVVRLEMALKNANDVWGDKKAFLAQKEAELQDLLEGIEQS